ncbi:glycosyltransferase, partial [Candidatus Pelagibacter ubique]|nr:glycosyltransferase [Candidatus Pelagibacter ubique]
NINFKRSISLFHDIATFFITLFFFLKKRPNLSISFTPKIGFMVALASFAARTPNRIHWFTGQIWANKKSFGRMFYKLIDKLIFSLSHKVLIDGFSQRNFLIIEKIVSSNKSIVLHNGSVGGVDVVRFKFNKQKRIRLRKQYSVSKNTFVFLYLGRVNKDKGIAELIEAFQKIKKNLDVLLIFVGTIEDTKLTHLLKNKKKILYFSYTNRPEDWFSTADILCLPSHREGFGTVVIEAASCGTPSLCSNIYGLHDAVIDNKTGFFHEVGSIYDIKQKMLYIIKNKKLVKNYGISARKKILRDFEKSVITKKLLNFIDSNIS